jgi:hypothetical protein
VIAKGSYVEIIEEVLAIGDRSLNIPQDTKLTPLKQWSKGWLLEESDIGRRALIRTVNGRVMEGIITEENPCYKHSFGEFISETMFIGEQAKKLLWGD